MKTILVTKEQVLEALRCVTDEDDEPGLAETIQWVDSQVNGSVLAVTFWKADDL